MFALLRQVAQPFGCLFLLMALGIATLWIRRKEDRRKLVPLTLVFGLLYLVCTPLFGHLAVGSLEWRFPPEGAKARRGAQAIVVLGGYFFAIDVERGRAEPELAADTIYRCMHAARIYRAGPPIPLLVSGGKVNGDMPDVSIASLMADFLVQLGVRREDVIVEGESRTTHENADASAWILRERGIGKIVLVTDAIHLERAARSFRKAGLVVETSGCFYHAGRRSWSLTMLIPSPSAAKGTLDACHEWFGLLWYRINGWV
jgi:uncharacterized SAM-binding protein YcdF (DUF218 family)